MERWHASGVNLWLQLFVECGVLPVYIYTDRFASVYKGLSMSTNASTTNTPDLEKATQPLRTNEQTLALLLFLEHADSNAVANGSLNDIDSSTYGASWWIRKAERLLDRIVQYVQQYPKVAHVELLVLDEPALSKKAKAHMATYIGDHANWRDSDDFYHKRRWRAIPVLVGSEHNVRSLCNDEVGTPYSLFQYLANVPPIRWIPRMWHSREQQTPSHCACLAARVMCRANVIQAEPALQTPSSLYILMLQTCPMTRSSLPIVSHEHVATTASPIELMDDATLDRQPISERLRLLNDLLWRTAMAGETASEPNHVSSGVALEQAELSLLQRRLSVQALRLLRLS